MNSYYILRIDLLCDVWYEQNKFENNDILFINIDVGKRNVFIKRVTL